MSNSSRDVGESSYKSMENADHHPMLIEGPPVPEKQKTDKKCSYHECQKNHAAAINGNARDGCGEFMAGGEEGTLEFYNCAACSCHRNYHRKEIEKDDEMEVPKQNEGYPMVPSTRTGMRRKRSRTKFTKAQKDKMLVFAHEASWRLQTKGESAVQQFCQEIGIKRKVLKVWMQNNKHVHLGINKNKNNSTSSNQL